MPDDHDLSPAMRKAYEYLKKVRESKTVSLQPCPLLRKEIRGFTGQLEPFRLRYYQVQGVYHMMRLKRMILGDGTGLGKCVTKDTLLVTDQGLVPIWELAPDGELVPDTFYPPRLPLRVWTGQGMVPVRRFYWNGWTKTRRLRTQDGFTVEGSEAHPVLIRDGEGERLQPLPSIEVGGYVCIDRSLAPFPEAEPVIPFHPSTLHPNCRGYRYPSHLTPELARLLGYVVAEAWTNGHYNVNISQHLAKNPEVHEDIRQLLEHSFGWVGNEGNQERDKLIAVSSVGIRQYLERCGVTCATSRYKEVPWVVLRGTRDSVREFLRGLLDAEGCVLDSGGVEFTTASERLARVTQLLLLRFGVVAARRPRTVPGYDHTYWRLSFFGESARTFHHELGFVSDRKVRALYEGLQEDSNPNKDTVPLVGHLVADLKEALLSVVARSGSNENRKGSGLKQFGESFQSTLKHVTHGRRNPTFGFLRRLLEISSVEGLSGSPSFQALDEIVRQHFYYDPVVAVEESNAAVMDVEVDHPDHCFSANGMVHHNTVEAIAALAYLWSGQREASNKILVLAPKSAILQWADEIERFMVGVRPIVAGTEKPDPVADCTCNAVVVVDDEKTSCGNVWKTKKRGKEIVCPRCKTKWAKPKEDKNGVLEPELIRVECESPADARRREYEDWANAPASERVVLIMNYALLVRDWNQGGYQPLKPNGKPDPKRPVIPGLLDRITQRVGKDKLVVIFDEATAFKSKRTKTWEICRFLADRAHRVYGLTATLLKNRLFEGYCIYGVIRPGLFTTQSKFHDDYCFVQLKKVGKARVPIILGYKNLSHFRQSIDPFFLGRPKHIVSDELPTLTTREVSCELSRPEDLKYQEALSGVLELGDGEVRVYEDHKALVSLMYCQQVVNSLAMLRFKEGDGIGEDDIFDPKRHRLGTLGSKEQGLVDLVTGELDDEKVIVYTKFASFVPRLQTLLKKHGIKSTCITGRENNKARQRNQAAFQDADSDTKVIIITDAGSEAINLQMAIATIFYDAPWSWGDYVQTIGRMVRIGSPHKGVLVFHLIAKRPKPKKVDQKTIDHHVLGLLRKKKGLIDKVLGEAAVGALEFHKDEADLRSLIRMMQGRG